MAQQADSSRRVSLALLVAALSGIETSSSAGPIPKRIYAFWNSPRLPSSVDFTIGTWKRNNPDYEVVIISPLNLGEHLSPEAVAFIEGPGKNMTGVSIPHLADLVRVELLAENGGVWLDATLALAQPLSAWLPDGDTESLFAFDLDFDWLSSRAVDLTHGDWKSSFHDGRLVVRDPKAVQLRMPETYALAAAPGCAAMRAYREIMRGWIQHPKGFHVAVAEAVEVHASHGRLHSDMPKWITRANAYLGSSFCLWGVLQRRETDPSVALSLQPAEEWVFAHLEYMPAPWSMGPALPIDYITDFAGGPMFSLARHESAEPGPQAIGPFLKLRKFERCALDALIDHRAYADSSPLRIVYSLPPKPALWPQALGEALAAFESHHCGTTDRFLLGLFHASRRCCALVFMFSEHVALVLLLMLVAVAGCCNGKLARAKRLSRDE